MCKNHIELALIVAARRTVPAIVPIFRLRPSNVEILNVLELR